MKENRCSCKSARTFIWRTGGGWPHCGSQMIANLTAVTNAAQYSKFPIAAGNKNHQFSTDEYQCAYEENRADISFLAEQFQQRVLDLAGFSSPFSVNPGDAPDHLQVELIKLQCDAECHIWHQQLLLFNFYHQLYESRFQEI